jgi:hypothetical protein
MVALQEQWLWFHRLVKALLTPWVVLDTCQSLQKIFNTAVAPALALSAKDLVQGTPRTAILGIQLLAGAKFR